MRELIGLHYSPWTEKAQWALDHHHLPYAYHEHLLIFEMPWLRWRLRRFSGAVTVPAMIESENGRTFRFFDSWDIALQADEIGSKEKLFPEKKIDDIRFFNDLSERALDAGRALLIDRMRKDPNGLRASLPPLVPKFLRPYLLFVAKIGLNYIARSFQSEAITVAAHEDILREALETVRRKLNAGKESYLLGDFSYADVTAAVILQTVSPVSEDFKKIGKTLRRVWTHPEFAEEFADLIVWRDRLYQAHRKKN